MSLFLCSSSGRCRGACRCRSVALVVIIDAACIKLLSKLAVLQGDSYRNVGFLFAGGPLWPEMLCLFVLG